MAAKKFKMDQVTEIVVQDLHRGIHASLEALVTDKNPSEAERILRMVDERMAALINQTEAV